MTAEATLRLGLVKVGEITVGIDVRALTEVCPVREVSRLLFGGAGLIGAVDLRGLAVPLIDLRALSCLPVTGGLPPSAAVVASKGRRIALGIDRVEGILDVATERLQSYFTEEGSGRPLRAGLQEGHQTISVLDLDAVMRADLPSAPVFTPHETRRLADDARPHLLFTAGGALFGVEATEVEATVPRREIERNTLSSGPCLGTIQHHGRRVPVVHANAVLGLGTVGDLAAAEIVILRFPEGRAVGLAVDAILRIERQSVRRQNPVPELLLTRGAPLSAMAPGDGGRQTAILDLAALWSDAGLIALAGLSDLREEAPSAAAAGAQEEAGSAVVPDGTRYLVVDAGGRAAVPIRQVVRIMEPPDELIALADSGPQLRGLFTVDGATVPLVALSPGQPAAPEYVRVLLVGPPGVRTGFLVDRVVDIETASWRKEPSAQGAGAGLVCLPRLGARVVLPRLDLDRAAHEIAGKTQARN